MEQRVSFKLVWSTRVHVFVCAMPVSDAPAVANQRLCRHFL
uniref:Uncharacterized protein n=1 Tax=Anguilla anguilla TaxID=7936 RepID=A0A0E9RRE6_ANGAN